MARQLMDDPDADFTDESGDVSEGLSNQPDNDD